MSNDTAHPTLDEEEPFHRILWYSDPGKGKTTNIANAAKFGKVIYIDSENGLKAKALRSHGIPVENIEPHRNTTYEGLEALHQEIYERLISGEPIFATAWDTTTKAAASLLDTIAYESAIKATRIGKDKTEFDTWQDDYGTLAAKMRKLIRRFHDLPCHLLIGAHQRRDIDEETSTVSIGPALSPAVQQDLVGYMDVVIHCRTEEFNDEDEFSGLTRPRGRFMAKDRYRMLPPFLIDPTFERVVDYIDDKIDRDKDPLQLLARKRRADRATAEVEKSAEKAAAKAAAKAADKAEPKPAEKAKA